MNSYISKIIELMEVKSAIRNICIVSHVDHGKTTLSDHILQAGGLISKTLVGTARVLDYLEEEQQRGITIKTANISFIYKHNNNSFLINLVDTPGHVDFSGMVSQAIRLVDGAIIVVDIVEGVMAQTESVIKQAMIEGLKPILFINKVDRLIKELNLTPEEIEIRLGNIIQMINELISVYAYEEWKQKWKVSFSKGTVIIGSALHGWAISRYSEGMKFSYILKHYKNQQYELLKKKIPLIKALMPMIIENIPSPLEAQKQRISHITERIGEDDIKKISECSDNNEVYACVGKLIEGDNKQILAIIRLFSGIVKRNTELINVRSNKKSKISQVKLCKGQSFLSVDKVTAGNIAVIIGLKDIQIGDTLTTKKINYNSISFKQISYLQEPVISMRIEPINISDIPILEKELDIFTNVKPNFSYSIDENTGEIRIYGIGELQLEIITHEIEERGIKIEISKPEVMLVEQIKNKVEHVERDITDKLEIRILCLPTTSYKKETIHRILYSDHKNNNLAIVKSENITTEVEDLLKISFKNSIIKGINDGYPIRNLTVVLETVKALSDNAFNYEVVVPTLKNAINKALQKGEMAVYEPIYDIEITTPLRFIGQVLSVFQKYGGGIEETEQRSARATVKGYISVKSAIQLSNELRHASKGFAFWQYNNTRFDEIKR